jgi:hypothetical protein
MKMEKKAQATLVSYVKKEKKWRISNYLFAVKGSTWTKTRVTEGREKEWLRVIELMNSLYRLGLEVRNVAKSFFLQFKENAKLRHETIELTYHLTDDESYPQIRLYRGKGKWVTFKFSQLRDVLTSYASNPTDVSDFLWLLSLEAVLFKVYNIIARTLEELNLVVTEKEEMRK